MAEATEFGIEFHPGVTLAVGVALKDVSSTLGVWHTELQDDNFVAIPKLDVEPIIPEELSEFVPPSYEWPTQPGLAICFCVRSDRQFSLCRLKRLIF